VLVFGELHGRSPSLYAKVIGGSLLMVAGAGAIALSSVTREEHSRWHDAAHREGKRYGVTADYVQAGLAGENSNNTGGREGRTWLDWAIVLIATAVFVILAALCRVPNLALNWIAAAMLSVAMLVFLGACGFALWRVTRFS
jgi:hypothetical protein